MVFTTMFLTSDLVFFIESRGVTELLGTPVLKHTVHWFICWSSRMELGCSSRFYVGFLQVLWFPKTCRIMTSVNDCLPLSME